MQNVHLKANSCRRNYTVTKRHIYKCCNDLGLAWIITSCKNILVCFAKVYTHSLNLASSWHCVDWRFSSESAIITICHQHNKVDMHCKRLVIDSQIYLWQTGCLTLLFTLNGSVNVLLTAKNIFIPWFKCRKLLDKPKSYSYSHAIYVLAQSAFLKCQRYFFGHVWNHSVHDCVQVILPGVCSV